MKNILRRYGLLFGVLLLTAGLIVVVYQHYYQLDENRQVQYIQTKVQDGIMAAEKGIGQIKDRLVLSPYPHLKTGKESIKGAYYVFRRGQLIYWTNNGVIPEYEQVEGGYHYRTVSLKTGLYVAIRQPVLYQNQDLEIFSLFHIRKE